ncbi:MAG: fumarylacetoacetase [Bacteroidetes Order II. Incertae sedis bacterium]|nr:fumarylacetoacetase [Bacteroidetes Order II. bacterium]
MQSFIHVPKNHPFPIQNLPYGVFTRHSTAQRHVGVAIGDWILDLTQCENLGLLPQFGKEHLFQEGWLNPLMTQPPSVWSDVRKSIMKLLSIDGSILRDNAVLRGNVLVAQSAVNLHLGVKIGDYTDFYASIHHASNVGKIFRDKDQPLFLNWKHMPIGYHGRTSSIRKSGEPLYRPKGQLQNPITGTVEFGPCSQLDFELELGAYIGFGNELGEPISVNEAARYIFGFTLLNDWSARDIQRFEYQPLGPFLGKNFATFVSPWVVPMEALEPFVAFFPKQVGLARYLDQDLLPKWDVALEVYLQPQEATDPVLISQTNAKELYWTFDQMIAHHTSNGCNLRPGDLLASGTISGESIGSYGSMLELSWGGKFPISVGAETRTWLHDGDTLTLRAFAQNDVFCIGFGDVVGTILPPK